MSGWDPKPDKAESQPGLIQCSDWAMYAHHSTACLICVDLHTLNGRPAGPIQSYFALRHISDTSQLTDQTRGHVNEPAQVHTSCVACQRGAQEQAAKGHELCMTDSLMHQLCMTNSLMNDLLAATLRGSRYDC